MKEQWKKYTQKFNTVILMPASVFIIANPSVVEDVVGTKYIGILMLIANITMSVMGSIKQDGVSRGT